MYKLLECAFKAKEPIPDLVTYLVKQDLDVPQRGEWDKYFENTTVYVE